MHQLNRHCFQRGKHHLKVDEHHLVSLVQYDHVLSVFFFLLKVLDVSKRIRIISSSAVRPFSQQE